MRATMIIATTRKTEFMGYYFTLTRKNSPQRARSTQRRKNREVIDAGSNASSAGKRRWRITCCRDGAQHAAPLLASRLPGEFQGELELTSVVGRGSLAG